MQIIKSIRASTDIRDAIPVSMIFATVVIDALWNLHAGIVYRAPLIEALATPLWPVVISAYFIFIRPNRNGAEAALFAGLWLVLAVFAVQLSYLVAWLSFPLRDAELARLDGVLGFDWRQWCSFANATPWFRLLQTLAYDSYWWQPFLCIAIFAWYRPGRNRELLTGMILASTVTVVVGGFLPAFGPGHAYGIAAPWDGTMASVRAGAHAPLAYMGIVSFPSLHAAGAVLFTVVHRGKRWAFIPAALLNGLMLVSLPLDGDHYLSDTLAGVIVGVCSFLAAKWILRNTEFCANSPTESSSLSRADIRRLLGATEERACG